MLAPRLAAGLLLAAVLSGCAGDEPSRPRALPSPSSAAGSPSPSIAASPSPADDRAAVEAAVRFYFDGFNRALDAKDADLLALGSTADCGCRSVVQDVRRALMQGVVEGNRYSVRSVDVGPPKEGVASASAVVDSSAGRVVATDGRVLDTLVAQEAVRKQLILRKEGEKWLVFSVADA